MGSGSSGSSGSGGSVLKVEVWVGTCVVGSVGVYTSVKLDVSFRSGKTVVFEL